MLGGRASPQAEAQMLRGSSTNSSCARGFNTKVFSCEKNLVTKNLITCLLVCYDDTRVDKNGTWELEWGHLPQKVWPIAQEHYFIENRSCEHKWKVPKRTIWTHTFIPDLISRCFPPVMEFVHDAQRSTATVNWLHNSYWKDLRISGLLWDPGAWQCFHP